MLKPSNPTEKLKRQQMHVERLQLWEHAHGHHCGPRSAEGKRRSALRATKHGIYSAGGLAMTAWVNNLRELSTGILGLWNCIGNHRYE